LLFEVLEHQTSSGLRNKVPKKKVDCCDQSILETAPNQSTLPSVSRNDMHNGFRNIRQQGKMHAINRMPYRRLTGLLRPFPPPRVANGIVLEGLAHVVKQSPGNQYVSIEADIWNYRLESIRHSNSHPGHGSLMIQLGNCGVDPVLTRYV